MRSEGCPRATAHLGARPYSPRLARRFVSDTLGRWRCGTLTEEAALLASELVTNAVLHACTEIDLTVSRMDGAVRVEVSDTSPRPVVLRDGSDLATGGRGLYLVEALARDWGVAPHPPGKAVWFELSE
jgi:anti-sigma regulatory factor (Ser/Thr protein kinase)